MAHRVEIKTLDDLTGEEGADTVTFGLGGKHYEIDLTEENAAKLRAGLAEFIAAARKAGGGPRRAFTGHSAGTTKPAGLTRDEAEQVRTWARANGWKVAERGRISEQVLEAHRNNTPNPDAEKPQEPEIRTVSMQVVKAALKQRGVKVVGRKNDDMWDQYVALKASEEEGVQFVREGAAS